MFSSIVLFTELSSVIFKHFNKHLSIFGYWINHVHSNSLLRTFAAAIPLLLCLLHCIICRYLFICFFRSFFLFKIPFVESYHLYHHHTDVYALSFNAYYLCRLQFSLCYHYFTLLQVIYFFSCQL